MDQTLFPPGPSTCLVPGHPQDQRHLPRAALPPPGPVPVAPDSGAPRARPATFRGGLCKHRVPPHSPHGIVCPSSQSGGCGRGTGSPAGSPPPAHAPTHGASSLTCARGGPGCFCQPHHSKGNPCLLELFVPLSFANEPTQITPTAPVGKLSLGTPPHSPSYCSSNTCALAMCLAIYSSSFVSSQLRVHLLQEASLVSRALQMLPKSWSLSCLL